MEQGRAELTGVPHTLVAGPLLLIRGVVSVGQADLAAETRACQAPEVRSLLAWPVSDPAVRAPLGLEHTHLR